MKQCLANMGMGLAPDSHLPGTKISSLTQALRLSDARQWYLSYCDSDTV